MRKVLPIPTVIYYEFLVIVLGKQKKRQSNGVELIASENFVSEQVMEAMGAVLTNKYAEGLPNKRYYGGCEIVDQVELLAIERVKKLLRLLNPKLEIIEVVRQKDGKLANINTANHTVAILTILLVLGNL